MRHRAKAHCTRGDWPHIGFWTRRSDHRTPRHRNTTCIELANSIIGYCSKHGPGFADPGPTQRSSGIADMTSNELHRRPQLSFAFLADNRLCLPVPRYRCHSVAGIVAVRSDFCARAPFPKRYFWPDSAACPVDQVRLDCLPALV